ncbi:MAG: DUF6125 family protein [Candidatus Helarchaeota archaeon]
MRSLKKEDKLLKFFMKNELNIYNIWFSEVEKCCSLEKAVEISMKVWSDIARIDSHELSEIFKIEGNDLDDILRLIDIGSYFTLTKIKINKTSDSTANITFTSCYWQKILKKRPSYNRKKLNCNTICLSAISSYITSINPEYEVFFDKAIPLGDDCCTIIIRKKR